MVVFIFFLVGSFYFWMPHSTIINDCYSSPPPLNNDDDNKTIKFVGPNYGGFRYE